MKTDNYIYLNRKTVLAAMISAAFPMTVSAATDAAAGKVEFASGGAAVQSADGSTKTLAKGMPINQGDTIVTGAGRAQVKFSDGGYLSFQPNTQFKIEEYYYNGKQDGTEKGFFRLVEGGLRALTGLVGRENRPAYRMATPVATIGIRGTYFLAEFREKLKTHVGHGSIYVFNDQGDIILFEGQGAEVEAGKAPQYSDEDMKLGAKGPEGATPDETKDQQQAEYANNQIYRVAEDYDDTGISKDLFGLTAAIANLNGIGAEGYYFLDRKVENVGGNAALSTYISGGEIYVGFAKYEVNGFVNVHGQGIADPCGVNFNNSYFISGNLQKSGILAATGSGYGFGTGGTSNFNLIGVLGGQQVEKMSVGYTITGDVYGGTVTGRAGFIANPPPAPYVPSGSSCSGFC